MLSLTLILAAIVYGPALLLALLFAWLLRKRRRSWAGGVGVLLTAYLAMLVHIGAVPGFNWYHDRGFTRQVFGTSFGLGAEVTSYETPRSLHGDGYSVWVYRVPEHVSDLVRRNPERLSDYPRRSLRPEWRVQRWTPARAAAAHGEYIRWALGPAPDALQAELESVLKKPGTWYAFLVSGTTGDEMNSPFIQNIDLFILDPATDRFYVVNSNT